VGRIDAESDDVDLAAIVAGGYFDPADQAWRLTDLAPTSEGIVIGQRPVRQPSFTRR